MTCEPEVQILILSVKPSSLSIYRDAGPLTNWPLSVSEGAICSAPTIGEKEKGVLPLVSNALIITKPPSVALYEGWWGAMSAGIFVFAFDVSVGCER